MIRGQKSNRKYGVAVSFAAVFGILGIHHFYLGCWIHGLIDLGLTVCALSLLMTEHTLPGYAVLVVDYIHTLIVTIILLIGSYRDGDGFVVAYPGQKLTQE